VCVGGGNLPIYQQVAASPTPYPPPVKGEGMTFCEAINTVPCQVGAFRESLVRLRFLYFHIHNVQNFIQRFDRNFSRPGNPLHQDLFDIVGILLQLGSFFP